MPSSPPLDLLHRAGAGLHNLRARLPGAVPSTVVLELEGSYPERKSPRRLPRFIPGLGNGSLPSLEELGQALAELVADPRVETVHLRLRGLRAGPATAASLRGLIAQAAGSKRVRLWAEGLSLLELWVASAASELVLPESADLGSWGLRAEVVFLRQLLDRWGVLPQIERVSPFKTAGDRFLYSEMSDAMRSTLDSITGAIYQTLVGETAAGRGVEPAAVRGLIDRAPLVPREAQQGGLVDRLGYEDELLDDDALVWPRARKRVRAIDPPPATPRVAVISLEGLIVPGRSRRLPLPVPLLGVQAGAESLAQALRRAAKDRRVAAIVLHIDSGGGSALASDLIWREVTRLDRRKPVVAYVSNVGGSGGYYVALGARRIVAQPVSILGSIGVMSGKFVLQGLLERLGMVSQAVEQGAHAGFGSSSEPFSESELERLRLNIQEVYERFTARVASARGLEGEDLQRVLGGRVWTASQALELGLVDELGDLGLAVRRAAEAAGLDPSRPLRQVNLYPGRHYLPPAAWELERLGRTQVWALLPYRLRFVS